eukprot:TRINITY_DN15678_c0_g1_i1.p2 TRINITY_DN15678_c0_g1~~TRINITY_DN15678_c0_g1_i1.p2  ORF type:complete len:140 (+),score=37.41 TRINITY_DN15678_c0_g1_i1:95-514(+)
MSLQELKETKDLRDVLEQHKDRLVVCVFMVEWSAAWLGIRSTFEGFVSKYKSVHFYKINIDLHDEVGMHEGITAVPTFVVYCNQTKIVELVGADPARLEEMIRSEHEEWKRVWGSSSSREGRGKTRKAKAHEGGKATDV